MKYSVNVPDELAMAAKAAAERAGVNQATWTRGALVSALKPAGPIEDLAGLQQDLERVRGELSETQKVLDLVTQERDRERQRTREDLEASQSLARELEEMTAQYHAADSRVRWKELDVEQAKEDGLKALENASKTIAGLETQIVGLQAHIEDLRRTLSMADGQLAEAARREREIMARIPLLPEQSGPAGRPWWSRWFRRT